MKTFKQFINEGNAIDFLKPKTDENIEKEMYKLNALEKFKKIKEYGLDDKFMPSDGSIRNEIDNLEYMGEYNKWGIMLSYKLPEKFFPKSYILEKRKLISNIKTIYEKLLKSDKIKNKKYIHFGNEFGLDDIFLKMDNDFTDHFIYMVTLNGVVVDKIYNDSDESDSYNLPYNEMNVLDLKQINNILDEEFNRIKEDKINEGNAMDYLKPKSKEDIKKQLMNKNIDDKTLIKYIFQYNLGWDLLPRNESGICIYNKNLDANGLGLTSLPNNFTINGWFSVMNNKLTKLPENLIVKGNFDCSWNDIKKIPESINVHGNLYCSGQLSKVLEKPKNTKIKGKIFN